MGKSLKVAAFLAFTSIKRGNIGVILLTILILTIVVLNLLFVPSLLDGLVVSADEKIKDVFAGDIIIESATDNPLISRVDRLIKKIESIDGVVAAVPRNSLGAEIIFENERCSCTVLGIQPERERLVFKVNEHMLEGAYLAPRDYGKIMLGIQVAGADKPGIELYSRSLRKVHAGDKVQVTFANGARKTYEVKGIFYTEFLQTDIQAFITEEEFKIISPLTANKASSIRIRATDETKIPRITTEIQRLDGDLKILTWEDYAGIVRSMTDSFNVINAILNVVNLLVAGITVFIVTYIDVTSRRKQIGIQRAIGITPSSITLTYLLRAFFYAIVASTFAALLFLYVVIPLEAKYPFRFPLGDVFLVTGFPSLTRAAFILLCAAVVAAFLPVWMALKIKILDAIWG